MATADEAKAERIEVLDVHAKTSVADYFVVCSGVSERQLRAIAEGIEEQVQKECHVDAHHIEGLSGGGWILVDYRDVVVHIFSPSQRAYYNLEALWSKAPVLLRMQ